MGKVWGAGRRRQEPLDVASTATSSRSPSRRKQEGLLYVGTDDGLIQVTEDGGDELAQDRRASPASRSARYVARPRRLAARRGPRSTPPSTTTRRATSSPTCSRAPTAAGRWTSIAGDLPARGTRLAIAEDHVDPQPALRRHRVRPLLHARRRQRSGCGSRAACRRSPCATSRSRSARTTSSSAPSAAASTSSTTSRRSASRRPRSSTPPPRLFPVKTAVAYIPPPPLGLPGKAFLGETFYTAPNPPFGAVFTYYLKDELKTKRKARHDAEKEAGQEGRGDQLPDATTTCAPRRARRIRPSC